MKEYVKEFVDGVLYGKEKYIEKPFTEMEDMQSSVLRMLTCICNEPVKCKMIIYENRDNIQPKVSRLIKNFNAKYYFRRATRKGYAQASLEFLKIINRIFELPGYPDSDLIKNSFLTVLNNRDYYTTYHKAGGVTFLGKIELLANYYYRNLDEVWNHVCEIKTLNDDTFI